MRIGFVTCQVLPEPDVDEAVLLKACTAAGLEYGLLAWDGDEAHSGFDLLVLRSCWNYHIDIAAFLGWLSSVESDIPVFNPPDIVRWNADKHYLADLSAKGVPTVPTNWVGRGTGMSVAQAASELNVEKVVVKPTVSAASWKTKAFTSDGFAAAELFLSGILTDRDAMVQPFLGSVETIGERSVVWIDGEVTHAIIKKPRFSGEEESVSEAVEPTDHERELFAKALVGLEDRLLYARLDLMLDGAGDWRVSELELIEPSLFLSQHPAALAKFVAALKVRL